MSHGDLPRLLLMISRLCLSPVIVSYLSFVASSRYAHYVPDDSSLYLTGFRYAQSSTRFVYFLSLTRLDVISVSYLYGFYACLYLYLSYLYIYWVGDGTIPIFNLLCNHPSVVT